MTSNFVVTVVVNVFTANQLSYGIGYAISALVFGEEIVVLSGAITDKWVIKLFCGQNY